MSTTEGQQDCESMAAKMWNGSMGAFASNANWLPHAAPVFGDMAIITTGTVTAAGVLPGFLVIELGLLNGSEPTLVLSNGTLVASSRLELKARATLQLQGTVINQGTITAGGGPGLIAMHIGGVQESGATNFINTGSVLVSDAAFQILPGGNSSDQLENDGTIAVRSPGGTSQLANISANIVGVGTVLLGSSVTFEVASAVGAGQNFVFEHGNAGATTLRMDTGRQFQGVINGFGANDSIQVISGKWDTAAYVPTDANGGVLTMWLGGVAVQAIVFKGSYMAANFRLQQSIPFGSSQASTTIMVDDPLFDAAYYLHSNPDVAAAGLDPYQHFMAYGWREGREPSLLFSDSRYLAVNPDVQAAAINPLAHYEAYGRAEGRAAFPTGGTAMTDLLIDASYYDPQTGALLIPAGIAGQQQAAWSYDAIGWQQGLNPDALFDSKYYLAQNPDVRAAGVDPLRHYEQYGWHEGREPSLLFSGSKYLAANPDVAAAAINPLIHYIAYGQSEGRVAPLTGNAATADLLMDTAFYDKQLGATLFPIGLPGWQQATASYDATGWRLGLNPDAFFDTEYYLSHNPDVAAAQINPIKHFEQYGWLEGRNPSAQFSTARYLAAYADVRAAGLDPLEHFLFYGQAEGRTAFAV